MSEAIPTVAIEIPEGATAAGIVALVRACVVAHGGDPDTVCLIAAVRDDAGPEQLVTAIVITYEVPGAVSPEG